MVNHLKEKIKKLDRFGIFNKKSQILILVQMMEHFKFFQNLVIINLFGIDPSASAFLENYNKDVNVIIDFDKKSVIFY